MKNGNSEPTFDTFKLMFKEAFGPQYVTEYGDLKEARHSKAFQRFYSEIRDVNRDVVGPLTPIEISLIRKKLYGFGFDYIINKLKINKMEADRCYTKGLEKILVYSNKGFINIVEDYNNRRISLEELMSIPLEEFAPTCIIISDVKKLQSCFKVQTLRDVIRLKTSDISKCDGLKDSGEAVISFVHGLGFKFANESHNNHNDIFTSISQIVYNDVRYCHYVASVNDIKSLKPKIENQINEIVKELEDTSLEKVECLTDIQTIVLREYLKIGGVNPASKENAKELGKGEVSSNLFNARLNEARKQIARRAARGCANLEKAVKSGEITRQELLAMPIYLGSDFEERAYRAIGSCCGLHKPALTYGVVMSKCTFSKICNFRGVGPSVSKYIKDHFHSLGLYFKDEYESSIQKEKEELAAKESLEESEKKEEVVENKTNSSVEDNPKNDSSSKLDDLNVLRKLALELAKCIEKEQEKEKELVTVSEELKKLKTRRKEIMDILGISDINKLSKKQ